MCERRRAVREDEQVRIEGEPGVAPSAAYLWLTADEARELRDTLIDLVARNDPSWHGHVASADFSREVTVALDA